MRKSIYPRGPGILEEEMFLKYDRDGESQFDHSIVR